MLKSLRASLHLAFCLMRIPHLALSLFAFPLVISVLIVWCQLVVTGLALKAFENQEARYSVQGEPPPDFSLMRYLLYGSGELRPAPLVCRWVQHAGGEEVPPDQACAPDRLDVALHVAEPAAFSADEYVELFSGQVDRVHLCKTCEPDIVIDLLKGQKPTSKASSMFGLGVLSLPFTKRDQLLVQRLRLMTATLDALGDLRLMVPDVPNGIAISQLRSSLPFAINIAVLVLISLWLALRAHRKVLDYFSRNDVLLPLAAACGKGKFYAALWILTLARVACFLCASVPLVFFGLRDVGGTDIFNGLEIGFADALVWLVSLSSTFALATIIASISELKHRHNLVSLLYKFVPITLAGLGALVWFLTFILPGEFMATVRVGLAAIPIVGISPILLGPVIKLPQAVMMLHAALAIFLVWRALKGNARWFAAHLEEV